MTICERFVVPHLQGPATTVTLPVPAVSLKESTARDACRYVAMMHDELPSNELIAAAVDIALAGIVPPTGRWSPPVP